MAQSSPLVFLSHSGADTEAARELKRRLENSPDARAAGLKVWFDKDDLRPGTPWSAQIADAIQNQATAFVVYVGSGGVMNWVEAEVDLALSRATTDKQNPLLFIPVLAATGAGSAGALPPFAKRHQGVRDPLGDGEELAKLLKAVLGAEWDRSVRIIDEPFVGLRSMREEEADRFFGRDEEVKELVKKFGKHRIVGIVADSGTGKSSLAEAGFAPAFRGGALADLSRENPDDHIWNVVTVRPRANPEEGLRSGVIDAAEKLGRSAAECEGLRERVVVADPSKTAYALKCGVQPAQKTATLLIVDQFEELFTETPDALCAPFVKFLLALADGDWDVRILLTVRADYFNLLSAIKDAEGHEIKGADGETLFDRLAAEGGGAILRLKRISEDGLRNAVCEPLNLAGDKDVAAHEALLKAVRREISDQPSDLPLLQVALRATWREHNRPGGPGLLEAYQSVGGVLGALAREAEAVRARLSPDDQGRLESIFVRLVRLGDTGGATRRTAALDEFDSPRQTLLRRLGDDEHGRLVVVGESSAEIAHEALITQWPWLQRSLKDDARDVRRLDRLMIRSREWSGAPADGKRAYLAFGAERELFAELANQRPDWLSPADRDFVRKSMEWKAIEQRNWWMTRSTVAALVFAVVGVGLFYLRERQARVEADLVATIETRAARAIESAALLAKAATEATKHPLNAAKLALAAWPRDRGDAAPKLEATLDVLGEVVPQLRERVRIPSAGTFASFSPDGTRIVTAPDDATARIWDAADGHEVATLKGHSKDVTFAAFSPDGKHAVTTSKDKTARIWDLALQREILPPLTHDDVVTFAAFSADGGRVVTASEDNAARIWDAVTGAPIAILQGHGDNVTSAAFSPDGKGAVTASADHTARIWDAADGREILAAMRHDDAVSSAAFSPDGTRIVTSSYDKTARIWDAVTGAPIAILQGHGDNVTSAAFSPDGRRVVTASNDNTARIWDAVDGREIKPSLRHEGPVTSAAFSFDGKWVVTASDDKTARIWDASTGHEIATLRGHDGKVFSAAFNNDATRVVTVSDDDSTTRVWDAALGRSIRILQGHRGNVADAAFSHDGRRVVTASDDGTARIWDAADGRVIATLTGHELAVKSAAFSPDGTRVVTASDDTTARLWNAASGAAIATLNGHEKWVSSAAFSPDGTRIVTASGDKTARLWDAANGRAITTLKGHQGPVNSAAFSPDGTRVVTASDDRTARLWNAASGAAIATLAGHEKEVESAAFSGDGGQVVTASWDKTARIWDVANGREIARLASHDGELQSAAFSPDRTRIVTVSQSGTVLIWDAASRREIATLKGHAGMIFSAAFSADGKQVVTGSQDKTARIWDVSLIPKGNILVVACALLPDKKLDSLVSDLPHTIDKRICGAGVPAPDLAATGEAR